MIGQQCAGGFELIVVIVNHGNGSKVLRFAKAHGITGGTVMLGRGTVPNKILEFLCISDVRKEIALLAAPSDVAESALDALNAKLRLNRPNHGIAFTTPLAGCFGTRMKGMVRTVTDREEENMYQAIWVIVDRGNGEEVIASAAAAGSRGGTIIYGRGSGIHETGKIFNFPIEPEKEIVLILAKLIRLMPLPIGL